MRLVGRVAWLVALGGAWGCSGARGADAGGGGAHDALDVARDAVSSGDVEAGDAAEGGPSDIDAADVETDAADAVETDAADAVETDAADVVEADAADASAADSNDGEGGTVRVVTGNLSSGTAQSYTPGEGARIFAGLHADVALIQEFNAGTNSAADLRAFVDTAFGPSFAYARGSGTLPNGVASRYPIVASGEWTDAAVSNRSFVWARIDAPGPRDLFAVSVHLLTTNATTRDGEAMALVALLRANVPSGDATVVGGDFNTDTRAEPCLATLGALLVTTGPYPADQAGNSNTNAPRSRPYDQVLADPTLDALEVPVAIGAARFADGLVFDTRVYTPLADVAPAMAGDSAAVGMQHMAVVRDFALPP